VLITFSELRDILRAQLCNEYPPSTAFQLSSLVFVLMILNHFIYLAILEKSYAAEAAQEAHIAEVQTSQVNN
jgi:hypothetical protein